MLSDLGSLVQEYGYGVVALGLCLEAMGLPLPGESLLITAAVYAATTGKISIEWLVLAAAAGAIMGDNFGYWIGHSLGRRALERYGPKVWLTVERQQLVRFMFYKYGGSVVFLGRFVAFLRTFVALLAGASQMQWGRFLFWNALGGVCWTCGYGYGAYFLGTQAKKLEGPVGIALGVIAAVMAVGVIWFLKRNEAKLIEQAKREMAETETETETETGSGKKKREKA